MNVENLIKEVGITRARLILNKSIKQLARMIETEDTPNPSIKKPKPKGREALIAKQKKARG